MIEVLQPGLYSSIQDLGRFEALDSGVPVSGVMDEYAAEIANSLVGNPKDYAVMEITMMGPKLKFMEPTAIALTGADMSPLLNGKELKNNSLIIVNKRDVLSFGKLKKGFRCYMAVSGGFQCKEVLGSKSMYAGITKAGNITKGDKISINASKVLHNIQFSKLKVNVDYLDILNLEVFKGPEFDKLHHKEQQNLLTTKFSISKDNSRMGYQLKELLKNSLHPIITSPVLPGTVQLTPSGRLIVLMKDSQTTGGYPRVLQLSQTAMNVLSQKFTGQKIQFQLKA